MLKNSVNASAATQFIGCFGRKDKRVINYAWHYVWKRCQTPPHAYSSIQIEIPDYDTSASTILWTRPATTADASNTKWWARREKKNGRCDISNKRVHRIKPTRLLGCLSYLQVAISIDASNRALLERRRRLLRKPRIVY